MKRITSMFMALCMLMSIMLGALSVNSAEIGTYENPENANDRYFAAAKAYLINTDLAEGDSDGYWYEFTSDGAGMICIDARAANDTDLFQITVECNGVTYYAFDEIFTRPIAPFRVSTGNVVKIHMTALPNESGEYSATKIYCNITRVAGNDSDPVPVKSEGGFIANVKAERQVTYQDGTNGGLYGGKGIDVTSASGVGETEIYLNDVVYTDTDKDGKIELMLPGDPNAMVALHPVFTVSNLSKSNIQYVVRVVDYAHESEVIECNHVLEYTPEVKACHKDGMQEYWYCGLCGTYFADEEAIESTDPALLTIVADMGLENVAAKDATCAEEGNIDYWHCIACGEYYADEEGLVPLTYEDVVIPKHAHGDLEFVKTLTKPTFEMGGIDIYTCIVCGSEVEVETAPLERWERGDLNNDGAVNAIDTNLHRRVMVGYTISMQGMDAADVNGDGELNAKDAFALKVKVSGRGN